jgi:hypothetical protein
MGDTPAAWCERGELNPHGSPHPALNGTRLPFRHSRQARSRDGENQKALDPACFLMVNRLGLVCVHARFEAASSGRGRITHTNHPSKNQALRLGERVFWCPLCGLLGIRRGSRSQGQEPRMNRRSCDSTWRKLSKRQSEARRPPRAWQMSCRSRNGVGARRTGRRSLFESGRASIRCCAKNPQNYGELRIDTSTKMSLLYYCFKEPGRKSRMVSMKHAYRPKTHIVGGKHPPSRNCATHSIAAGEPRCLRYTGRHSAKSS